jgi:uncharacterized protein (TIGR03435 family)
MTKGVAASDSTPTLVKGALKIMAWTKLKTTLVVAVVVVLAAGTTTVTVKEIAHHREDSVWSLITRLDSRQLDAAPPTVSVRPARIGQGGSVWSGRGKRMAFRASVAVLLSSAYDISEYRIVDSATLPPDKYDFIVSLPNHQAEALQAEIKRKLGLVARKEMRETDVLLLKVARQNAPGLKPADGPDSSGGSGERSDDGKFTCNNLPISALRSFLENWLRTPVIDQTALTDNYDIDLKWSPGGFMNPDVEALKQAVLDTLGLELVPSREPVEMLVVEKAK